MVKYSKINLRKNMLVIQNADKYIIEILRSINTAMNNKYNIDIIENQSSLSAQDATHLLETIKLKKQGKLKFYDLKESMKQSNETLKKLGADI
jgi:hypothetical protein